MCSLQGGSIVGAIARDSYHLATALKGLHQTLFVHRTGTGDDDDVTSTGLQLLIGHRSNLRTSENTFFTFHSFIYHSCQSNLSRNLHGGGRGITRDDFHINASSETLLHCCGNIHTYGVCNGY